MRKKLQKIKTILAIVMMIVGVLWILPGIFVVRTQMTITDYALVKQSDATDTYELTFTYQKDGNTLSAKDTVRLAKDVTPKLEQNVCHYYTIPPHSVHFGDPISPEPPLWIIVIGMILFFVDVPDFRALRQKWAQKHKKTDREESENESKS